MSSGLINRIISSPRVFSNSALPGCVNEKRKLELVSRSVIEVFRFARLLEALIVLVWSATVLASNETAVVTDPFEENDELRYAADTFCHEYTLLNPAGKIALPYKPNCHFWWQCTASQLKKYECQGANHRINLHYDLYLDRCELPPVKCSYQFDEEEIIMEHIMEYYKPSSTEATKKLVEAAAPADAKE